MRSSSEPRPTPEFVIPDLDTEEIPDLETTDTETQLDAR